MLMTVNMTSELMLIDELKIDQFNPYAIPDEYLFSPGIPKMGGYKTGGAELEWYEPTNDMTISKDPSPACGMPSVGDYSIDFCVKKPQVRNIQPGWAMEFDAVPGKVTSAYGLMKNDPPGLIIRINEFLTTNWFIIVLLGLIILYLLR